MTPYEKLKKTRQNGRPTGIAYINGIFSDRVELHGDRRFAEDAAIVSGIGSIDGLPVTYIAIEKGTDLATRMKTNFGCPKPEGYRKALRLMKQAEKFGRPVICFVDTQGAFCGADGEERGQGEAIAENIMEMLGLKTPTISIVIGEGGSGGALAICSADRVYMMENAVYSVISPEGCASILWKDASRAEDAAQCLRITADDMKSFGVAETIIPENFDDFSATCEVIKKNLKEDLSELLKKSTEDLLNDRYRRFRKFGIYEENGETHGTVAYSI
ncbi:MAG: acetyl-CoA carboxylase carboxyl transferase subunit alpha [Lachnospiraceae bacterium]|nr:acetyl-CoA carboxylase carboxyl transferase subunit alpha [Lachnospiraceae bacterium]